MTDLKKIRQNRELFSAVYPLSPEIWLRWLKTESMIASSEADIDAIVAVPTGTGRLLK
jgi:squamous cell carcinoma antigen recognized by T-cells 3